MKPSVVIITKNEAENIADCLLSIPDDWPCVLVDSGSTDETIEIAAKFNVKIISQSWKGFGRQKQFAVEAAESGWVLSLDADERLSQPLIRQIEDIDGAHFWEAFAIPRLSHFLGKPIRFCGWRPDYVIRLFHSSRCRFTEDIVHERVEGYKSVSHLSGDIIHFPYKDKDSVRTKIQLYGSLGKQKVIDQNGRTGIKIALIKCCWAFVRTYILKLGFLDGLSGLAVSWMNTQVTFIKYR